MRHIGFAGYFNFFDKKYSEKDREAFDMARSVTFNHHSRLDEMLNKILTAYFAGSQEGDRAKDIREHLLEHLSFERKKSILRKLKIMGIFMTAENEKDYLRKAKAINRIRNAFTRSNHIDSKVFEYEGKHVVYEGDILITFDRDARKMFDLYCATLSYVDLRIAVASKKEFELLNQRKRV